MISREILDARAPRGLHIKGNGDDTLRVSGNVSFLGQSVPVTADLKLEILAGGVRLTPVNVQLAGGIRIPNAEKFITFTVPVKDLPLNLKITSVKTTPDGLAVEGTATDVPLR